MEKRRKTGGIEKVKILFGITSLTLGGAERVLVDLANQLQKENEITILTIYAKGELEKQLNNGVTLKSIYPFSYADLSKVQKIWLPLKLLLWKRQVYRNYVRADQQVEIAFLEGPITRIFSTKNKKTRKIAWIHNDIGHVFGTDWKAKIKKQMDRKIYSKYDTLVFVSKDNQISFEKVYPDLRNEDLVRVHQRVVYNYVDKQVLLEKAEEEIQEKLETNHFLQVSRLTEQKAIDRLIMVHDRLLKDGYHHHIYVIGDGPEKEKLEKLIQSYGVQETFHLLGKKENPYPYMKVAERIILLSHFEGYPMVIEEAKILNKPIMITNTAAREVVKGYENSKIVENTEEGIYQGIKEVLSQKETQKQSQKPYDNSKYLEKVKKVLGEEK